MISNATIAWLFGLPSAFTKIRSGRRQDASNNRIDLVVRPTRSGRRYFPPRDAGIVRLHGVGLRTTNHLRDLAFWRALGAEVSDWVDT